MSYQAKWGNMVPPKYLVSNYLISLSAALTNIAIG